ncbi:uncharacterized protein LOC110117854 isoform X1 [Ceratitis capitata]|uniref:uncharacterized protein LOC110117854 isoform X1 n=1 Tax=Ceratitis capitata TaxID=7213 RepID=UPI000A116A96|nr:uncharacterized protein LOC110117854 isoform X1 [Ceratitis capitata]
MEVFDTCNEENLNESSADGTLWETLKERCSRVPAYRMFKDVSGPTGTQKIAFEMIIDNAGSAPDVAYFKVTEFEKTPCLNMSGHYKKLN